MIYAVVVLVLLLVAMVIGAVLTIAVSAFSSQFFYDWVRRKNTRSLTDEEKWQETSIEALSEEEWAATRASMTHPLDPYP